MENEVRHQKSEIKSQAKDVSFRIDFVLESLRSEIKDSKREMIKWFSTFSIILVLMILGLYATILLK